MDVNAAFQWKCQPEAENLIINILEIASEKNSSISKLAQDLLSYTNTRIFDWLDYVEIKESEDILQKLSETGFIQQSTDAKNVFVHPGAQLPRVVINSDSQMGIAISVDSIADFLMCRGENRLIEGSLFGNFRRCLILIENGTAFWVTERRGTQTLQPSQEDFKTIYLYHHAIEKWMTRNRSIDNENEGMRETIQLVQEMIDEVGQHRAAWTVLEGERRYWQSRNTAGQIQKNRQDKLGMGWSNHDHHTFRSSRRNFIHLVHLFELLGFHCRERFYAGEEAGWGAQVMENSACRLVLFLDVDLSPNEISRDFAHESLPELEQLGTIGLWCALHGDSILNSGMHHLEAQFMFEELTDDLEKLGVSMMNPFSSFPYLKQAFTIGEKWNVNPKRVQLLIDQGKITPEQGERFISQGAIGSHLENLQRREGYKGFNQNNVSIIIKKTDPRLNQ